MYTIWATSLIFNHKDDATGQDKVTTWHLILLLRLKYDLDHFRSQEDMFCVRNPTASRIFISTVVNSSTCISIIPNKSNFILKEILSSFCSFYYCGQYVLAPKLLKYRSIKLTPVHCWLLVVAACNVVPVLWSTMKQFKYLLCGCDIIEDASQQIKVFDTDFRAWRIYFNYIKVRVIFMEGHHSSKSR